MFKNLLMGVRRRWGAALVVGGAGILAVILLQSGATPRRYSAQSRIAWRDALAGLIPGTEAEPPSFRSVREKLPAELRDVELHVEAEEGPGERYRLRTVASDGARAVEAANAAARVLREESRAASRALWAKALEAQERKVEGLRDTVGVLETKLGQEVVQSRDRQRKMAVLQASAQELEKQGEALRARQEEARGRIRELEGAEHRLREAPPSGDEEDRLASRVLDRLRTEMDSIRSKIAVERLARTPDSPEYKELTARLGALQDEYRAELFRVRALTIVKLRESIQLAENEHRALDERRLRKDMEILQLSDEIGEEEPRRKEAAAYRRQLEAAEELVRKVIAVREAPSGPVVILQEAAGAKMERGGWPGLLPWGILASVVLGLIAAAAADRLDVRVRTDADVRRYLNLPSLALVPEEEGGDALVHRQDPTSPLSETFSAAATVLGSYFEERDFRTCAVMSGVPDEGKSTVAANLAVALARKGANVALVDADLRSPRLHEIFSLDNTQGLSTYLLGGEDPNYFLSATEVAQLYVLTSGPTDGLNPEVLESARMSDLLKALREKYDVVLFDGPPIRGAGSALTLARLVDTNVWVIRSGQSDRRAVGWAKHLLKNVRADVAGVILNRGPAWEGQRYYVYPTVIAK